MNCKPITDYRSLVNVNNWRYIKAWAIYTWGGLHRYFGHQNTMQSEHMRAIHYFTRAYAIDPRLRTALLDRAILLGRELHRIDEALADFDTLLANDPHYAPALLNRGLMLQEIGRYQEALHDLEAYVALVGAGEHHQEALRIIVLLRDVIADIDEVDKPT